MSADETKPVPAPPEKTQTNLWGWPPIDSLRHEIDRLFEDFPSFARPWSAARSARDIAAAGPAARWAVAPPMDLVEKEKAFEITAELPGLDDDNIEVKVANGVLTIRGEKKEEKEEKRKDYFLSERRYGSFQRSFRLPESVEADKIEAHFEKGVLKVLLPKSVEAAKGEKKIAVKSK